MRFSWWLKGMRMRLHSNRRRAKYAAPAAELLEDKTLLSVTVSFLAGTGQLSIISDAGDAITVRDNAGNVEVLVNGTPDASLPPIASSSVKSLFIQGGDDPNAIDISGISAATFPNLTNIDVRGGNGNDTITGSSLADTLRGEDGNDMIT
ncbi:MAG: hypothetical protein GXP27_19255, partial [Planctomycetes bacterium]|nr:hypothetical protein [Planctomycetota bacterium]